ncbi:MAG: hypothetical protein VX938_01595, partial [Myxococcota bacterium]|nr:hypothetical protein [Myxococcota bacterium]
LVGGVGITARTMVCFAQTCKAVERQFRAGENEAEQLRDLQLHVAMLHDKMSDLLHRSTDSEQETASPGDRLQRLVKGRRFSEVGRAKALVKEFLVLLSHYHQPEVSEDIRLQRAYDALTYRVKLDALLENGRHERQALESLIEHHHERNTELILYLIGLMGVVEATNGIHALLTMEPKMAGEMVTWLWFGDILPPWYWIGGGSVAVVLAVVGLWRYKST